MGQAFFFVVEHFRAFLWGILGFYALLLVTLPLVGKVPIMYSVRNLLVREDHADDHDCLHADRGVDGCHAGVHQRACTG